MALKNPVVATGLRIVAPAVIAASVTLIAGYEGLRLMTYPDPVGILTFCYGETLNAKPKSVYTEAECRKILQERVGEFATAVDVLVTPPMPLERHVALTSFAYNAGLNNFAKSTLLRKLNAGDVRGACNELPRWVYARGVKLPGLVRRREEERRLCLKGVV